MVRRKTERFASYIQIKLKADVLRDFAFSEILDNFCYIPTMGTLDDRHFSSISVLVVHSDDDSWNIEAARKSVSK